MRVFHLLGELASGVALMLFVPLAALAIGIPIVLLVRLVLYAFEQL
jgi:hypothetical protein